MACIASIPLEVLFLVTAYLDAGDIKSLRLSCQDLNSRLGQAHLDELFGRRTYFATVADLRQLLDFTRHPSGVNSKLKHLRLDVATPYIFIPPQILMQSLNTEAPTNDTAFDKACFANDCYNFEAIEEKEDQALLTAAIQNLPNLEIIEFVDRTEVPSIISLKIHYPDLIKPGMEEDFIKFYKEHATRQRHHRLNSLFLYVMVAMKHSQCRPKEILMESPLSEYMYVYQDWFDQHRRHAYDKGLLNALASLRILELNLSHAPGNDDFDEPFEETFESRQGQLQRIPKFLTEVVPNIETLKLGWDMIEDVWATEVWIGEYSLYEPNLLLKNVEIRLPKLKRLELRRIPFVERELVEVLLIPHKDTLRHLVFESCVMQEKEIWSSIFKLNGDTLRLESFMFRFGDSDEWASFSGRRPRLFNVWGDVNSDKYVCEVQPTKKRPPIKTDFKSALKLVGELETRIPFSRSPNSERSDASRRRRDGSGPFIWESDIVNQNDSNVTGGDDDDDDDENEDGYSDSALLDHDGWYDEEDDDDEDDDDDDDDEDDDDGPLSGTVIFPPAFQPPPAPIIRTYSAQPAPNSIWPAQVATVDNSGNLVRDFFGGGQQLSPSDVVISTFAIPGQYLNKTALEGRPLTVQNVLANLASNALDVGVQTAPPPGILSAFGMNFASSSLAGPSGSTNGGTSISVQGSSAASSKAQPDATEETESQDQTTPKPSP